MAHQYAISADYIGPKHSSKLRVAHLEDPSADDDATPKKWVSDSISSAVAVASNPFEASNGWISGGVISLTPGTTQFSVSACVCRFVDYTNETAPSMSAAVTLGPWNNVNTLHPAVNVVGIVLKSDGTLLQDTDAYNIPILYGPYIHIGTISHQAGLLTTCSNSKFPVADRYGLAVTDFIQRVSPINISGNAVTASTVADLSISVAEGYVWQHMSEVVNDRTQPNYRYKAASNRPMLGRVWRNTGGSLVYNTPSQQLDTLHYNPGGTGAAPVDIPVGEWVNFPIIYSPTNDTYDAQYPTESYATEDYALGGVGKFIRFDSTMHKFIIIGYVTVQQGATDLTDAEFSRGEFFNYSVYTGSSATDVDARVDFRSNSTFLDYQYGNDSTGHLNLPSAPFKTFQAAVAGITSATTSSQWVVRASGGLHVEPTMLLLPNTALVGEAPRVAMYDVSAGFVGFDPSFANSTTDGAVTSLYCGRFVNSTPVVLDLYSLIAPGAATSSTFDSREVGYYGDLTYAARTLSDITFWVDTGVWKNWTFRGGNHYIFDAIMFGAGSEELLCDATDVDLLMEASNLHCKNLRLVGPTASNSCVVTVSGSNIHGTIVVNGSGAHLDISRGSLAGGTTVTLLNGGSYAIYDADLSVNEQAAIHSALPAPSASNYFVTLQKLNADLGTKVSTSVKVNGNALNADVSISASSIMLGTLPHPQLPLLLQTDIPSSLTSNTSGYAGSLNGLQTFVANSVMATGPALYDDSDKIATTGWVYDMRGAGEGLASLVGGKIPVGEIPDGLVSGLKYQGTWNCTTQTNYPAATLSGEFYIVSVGGTMEDAQTYAVGDWFVYNSVSVAWEKVPAVTDLSTWTGNTYISSVGTITAGNWHGTIIDESRGGAGSLTGILKGNAGGPVTVASSSSDYVLPSGTSTISGDKTFSGALYVTTTLDWTSAGSSVANAGFVQDVANFSQDQLIYVAKVGNDANDGKTIRNAVKTVNRAIYLAQNNITTALGPAYQYGVICHDAGFNSNVSMAEYVSFEGPNMRLSGTTYVASYSKVVCRRMDSPGGDGSCVHYKGITGAGIAFVSTYRILSGSIIADANMGTCILQAEIVDGLTSPTLVVDCGANTTLYIRGAKLTGRVKVVSGGILDLTAVADLTLVDVDPASAGTIYWPARGAGNVTGILKCDGVGSVTAATPGSDYLITNVSITLGGDLSGSGSTSINATIGAGAVGLSKMADLGTMRVIGNSGLSATVPQALLLSPSLNASSVVWRDTSANFSVNHASEAFTYVSADITLNIASPRVIEVTGTAYRKVTLPDATTLPLGFAFKIINDATTTIDICKHDGVAIVKTLDAGVSCDCLVADNGSANGTWVTTPANQLITLTGDVSASGRSPISVTLNAISLSKLDVIPALSVVANPVASPAIPITVSMFSSMTGDVLWRGVLGSTSISTIPASSITLAKLVTMPGNALLGNLSGSNGNPVTVGASLTMTGDVSWVGTIGQTSGSAITAGAVTISKIANISAYSVIGNPTSLAGVAVMSAYISMSGDVSFNTLLGSSGNSSISAGAVTLAKMANLPLQCVIGNPIGSAATPSTISISANATASAICIRDVNANCSFNKVIENCTSIATAAGNTTLGANSTTPGTLILTGTSTQTITLPDATAVAVGWSILICNNSTGTVTVNSAAASQVSALTGGLRGRFISESNAVSGGSWNASISSAWPLPSFTNSMTAPRTIAGGSTFNLSASDIYNGPQAISRNGGTTTATFRFPDAASMIAFIGSQAGLGTVGGNLTPPVGFSWYFNLYCAATACAASAGTGVTLYPASPPNLATVGHAWNGRCWITSGTTYNILFVHEP